MGLKTLKDLAKDSDELSFGGYTLDTLKEEAIKWYHRSDGNKHAFIMEFFNLTEEDLK